MILITLISACVAAIAWMLWRAHSNARVDRWLAQWEVKERETGT